MTDIHKQKTPVAKLGIGMFVTALDRPWLGTPFLLEGLLIENQEQINIMDKLCEFVYVDHTVSVGEFFIPPARNEVAIKREANSGYVGSKPKLKKLANLSPAQQKFSFYNILKEIQASNQASKNGENNQDETDNILLNIQNINSQVHTASALANDNLANDETPQVEPTSLIGRVKDDLSNFLTGMGSWSKPNKKLSTRTDPTKAEKSLAQDGSEAISAFEDTSPVEDEIAEIYPTYHQSQIATKDIFEKLALNQKIDITHVNEALDHMVASIERNPDALIWLAKLKQSDNYAYNHALNVSITLMAFASYISMPKADIKNLGMAGLLQDVGKGKIPHNLLHKSEKLSNAEFSILKKHVEYSIGILRETPNIPEVVFKIVAEHHERFNGKGYPNELMEQGISMGGQMAGLIDTYCAMTTNKVYAKGVYNQVALERIQKMGNILFSATMIDQLVQFLGIYPVTSIVELNSGEVGVVIQQNSVRRMLPRVMILLNADKSKNTFPATINLINKPLTPSGEPYSIKRGLPADSFGLNASNFYA
ncbi:MAG: HD domain-containing phosphohydrolase [Methylophilaceae bacterium]